MASTEPDDQQRSTPIRAGGMDWPVYWRQKAEARLAIREAVGSAAADSSTDSWANRAEQFARRSRELNVDSDPLALAIRAAVRPADSVLDVGAGAGRYTFAVAPLVAQVTAVEPSAGMRAALQQEATTRKLTNITVVPSRWEEAAIEPHDIAFVSSVLYFVADAVPFLDKLDRSARRACYIFHRVEERAAVLGPGWDELAGSRPPEPGFLDLHNLLFALGIRANTRILRTPADRWYKNIDEALEDARQLLGGDPTDHADDSRIRDFLAGALVQKERGLRLRGTPEIGVIWWEKGVAM